LIGKSEINDKENVKKSMKIQRKELMEPCIKWKKLKPFSLDLENNCPGGMYKICKLSRLWENTQNH
jgi:hypothetical protein